MTAKTAAQLKAEFQGTDPQDFVNDMADTAKEAASATVAGVIELATNAEVQTGTDALRAVTPAGLAACTATATRAGVVELATPTEAVAGTDTARAVTPQGARSMIGGLRMMTFTGRNGAGACTATGLAVGDVVLAIVGLSADALGIPVASFETTITVVDQIQQTSVANLSANNYAALLYHPS